MGAWNIRNVSMVSNDISNDKDHTSNDCHKSIHTHERGGKATFLKVANFNAFMVLAFEGLQHRATLISCAFSFHPHKVNTCWSFDKIVEAVTVWRADSWVLIFTCTLTKLSLFPTFYIKVHSIQQSQGFNHVLVFHL